MTVIAIMNTGIESRQMSPAFQRAIPALYYWRVLHCRSLARIKTACQRTLVGHCV
ncbi:hypothetical protein H6G91_31880 [Nostoc muscorum FACHB-395]|jgi:hypothetical protein|nr:hypothetical protein [Desmonostoc muscorum FACHB-395]